MMIRFVASMVVTAVLLLLTELFIRGEVTHVVRKGVENSTSIQADPELLVESTARGRRYVKNAEIVIRNHYLSNQDVEIVTNSQGLRHRPLVVPKPQGDLRVLVLGDSITAADSVRDEDTFVRILERSLRAEFHFERIEVINAGISNVGITEEANIFEDIADEVQPDVTLLMFYLNDSRPPWGFAGEIGDRGWLRRHSVLYDTLYRIIQERVWMQKHAPKHLAWVPAVQSLAWRSDSRAFRDLANLARYDWGAAWLDESWTIVEEELQRLQTEVKERNSRLIAAILPVSFQLDATFEDKTPQNRFESIARSLEIPVIDLMPALMKVESSDRYYDHCHPTPVGNEAIANALKSFVAAALQPTAVSSTAMGAP